MNKYKVMLLDEARAWYKLSSVRLQSFLAVLLLVAAYLQSLLLKIPGLLDWANSNWPSLQPLLAHFFPSVTQANWIVIFQVLVVLLRVTSIEKKPPA